MSIPAMTAVGNRIGEIRGELRSSGPAGESFAAVLETAQSRPPGPAAASGITTALGPGAALPIGILGTPIIVTNGLSSHEDSWIARLPDAGRAWASEIETAAADAGIDPRLLAAVVWQESGFTPDAVSRSGAIGLAQLMPGTASGLGVDPWDPVQNLDGGARYLAWTTREFGSIELGLAAYNAGPGRVREADGIPNIPETQAYVPRVLDYYRQLGGLV